MAEPERPGKPPADVHNMLVHLFRPWVQARLPYHDMMRYVREAYIQAAIEDAGGNQCEAARRIRCHRGTVQRVLIGDWRI